MNNAKVAPGYSMLAVFLALVVGGFIGFFIARELMKRRMKKRNDGKRKMRKGGKRKMRKDMKKAEPVALKGEADAKGEPAEVQSVVAQYMIENGL